MSKPLTKNQIATMKQNANGNETVLLLIAEVERLQKLAKPNRKPTTRKPAKPYVARSNHEVLYD